MAVERALTHSDLMHDGERADSPAMRRAPPVPESHLLPGLDGPLQGLSEAMDATDAFAIDDEGNPLDLVDPNETEEGEGDYLEANDQMDDRELLARLVMEERDAVDFASMTVAQQRADAMDYYFGREFGNEEDNQSSAISTDVFDVVETMLPAILKPFVSTDDVMSFTPLGPNDTEAADQESAYLNHVFMHTNDGFGILRKWVWDGLAQKNGVVKYWWDTIQPARIERYFDLTADVLAMIMQDENVEIIEGSEHSAQFPQGFNPVPAPIPGMPPEQMPPAPMVYDITVRIKEKAKGFAHVAVVPPEEFLISRDATDANPKKARFCEHRRLITISELRQMGYEVDDDMASDDVADLMGTPEYISRHTDDNNITSINVGTGPNREVVVREMYYNIDYDGDGIAEKRCFVVVGDTILDNYEIEEAPFSGWTPYVIPHKYFGVCPADMAMDTQLQKSTLVRQVLNNAYGINNNRAAISNRVNYDDIMTNVVNGFVRINADQIGNDIVPLTPQSIISDLLPAIQYLDAAKENRQGISRLNKGLDANTLNPISATEAAASTEQSQEREQLIARTFAETGLKDLMVSLHGLIRRHGNAPETFQMTGRWVTVDPRSWRKRTDMSITVGLGTGNKQAKMAFYQMAAQQTQPLMGMGLVTPVEVYNLAKAFYQAGGEKDYQKFVKDPTAPDFQAPAQQPPPEIAIEQMRQQGKEKEIQANAGIKAQELQFEAQHKEQDRQQQEANRQADLAKQQEVQRSNDERDAYKAHLDAQLKAHQAELDAHYADLQHQRDAQKEIEIANIKAAAQLEVARISAAQSDGADLEAKTQKAAGYDVGELLQTLIKVHSAPKMVIRDPKTGQAIGVQTDVKGTIQ